MIKNFAFALSLTALAAIAITTPLAARTLSCDTTGLSEGDEAVADLNDGPRKTKAKKNLALAHDEFRRKKLVSCAKHLNRAIRK